MAKKTQVSQTSRREFVKKAAYVAPAVLTLAAAPSFARAGSSKSGKEDKPDPRQRPTGPWQPHS
jgi:hypothetical protein